MELKNISIKVERNNAKHIIDHLDWKGIQNGLKGSASNGYYYNISLNKNVSCSKYPVYRVVVLSDLQYSPLEPDEYPIFN